MKRSMSRLLGPPTGVVPARLRGEDEVHPGPLERRQEGGDHTHWVEPIGPPIDDEERFVREVGHIHQAVGPDPWIQQHGRMTDEREKRRLGGGVPEAEEVHAGTAVRPPERVDPVLVHVVRALQVREDASKVLDLAPLPPERLVPRLRKHRDAIVSPSRRRNCATTLPRAHDLAGTRRR